MVDNTGAALSEDTFAVAIVHVDHGPVFFGKGGHLVKGGDITVHRKDTVRNDEFAVRGFVCLQHRLEFTHVVVCIDRPRRLCQPNAVDDGTVIQLIGNDDVLWPCDEGRDEAHVDGVACGVDERGFNTLEFSHFLFGLEMDVHRTCNGADGTAARTVGGGGLLHGSNHPWMGGEIEVIIGREHDGGLSVHLTARLVRTLQRRRFPQQRFLVEFVVPRFHPRHVARHGASSPFPACGASRSFVSRALKHGLAKKPLVHRHKFTLA